ncbi:hypothetical protein BJ166DRAFT_132050 [Pestalotiopsis sp. NC0098]|nr:hypothetical protein BJ166DRAFT_132050 [Pestalotiopsis sp. NC0098]
MHCQQTKTGSGRVLFTIRWLWIFLIAVRSVMLPFLLISPQKDFCFELLLLLLPLGGIPIRSVMMTLGKVAVTFPYPVSDCHSLTRHRFQWPASQSEAAYPTMYAHVHVSIHRTSDLTSRTSSTRRERMQSPDTVSWSFLQLSLTNRQHLVEPQRRGGRTVAARLFFAPALAFHCNLQVR